jgi:hypothetical protein
LRKAASRGHNRAKQMNQAAPDSPATIRSVLARAGLIGTGETPRMDALC